MKHVMKIILWMCGCLVATQSAVAQVSISGKVQNEAGQPILSVIVSIFGSDTTKTDAYGFTKKDGSFAVSPKTTDARIKLRIARLGYETIDTLLDNKTQAVGTFTLQKKTVHLKTATVRPRAVRAYGDTLEFNVAALKEKSDRSIEDVIKRLPGVEVKGDGSITVEDKSINKFYIEGMDLLGGAYNQATRNVRPDDVSKIQILYNHQPEKVLKDVEYSDRAALNLQIKKKRLNKPIGHLNVGVGYGDDVKWLGDLFSLFIGKRTQQMITLKGNNFGNFQALAPYTMDYGGRVENYAISQTTQTNTYQPLTRGGVGRSEESRSAKVSFNQLFKLSDTKQVKVNAEYIFNRTESHREGLSDYYIDDQTRLALEEKTEHRDYMQKALLSTYFENNSDKVFFRNTLNGVAGFAHSFQQIGGTNQMRERAEASDYFISDEFKADLKHKKNVVSVSGKLFYADNPKQQLHIYDLANDASVAEQHMKGSQFWAYIQSGYRWQLKKFTNIGLWGNFSSQVDRFRSFLGDDITNRNKGYELTARIWPSASIRVGSNHITLAVPIRLIRKNYVDLLASTDNDTYETTRVFAEPRLSISSTFSRDWNQEFSMNYGNSLGGFSSFIINPVYTSYRSTRSYGYGQLQKQKTLSTNYTVRFNNPLIGLNADLSANYNFQSYNNLSGSHVTTDETTYYTQQRTNRAHSWGTNLNFKKYFYNSRLLLTLSGGVSGGYSDFLRQEMLTHNVSYNYTANGSLRRSFWAERISTEIMANYNRSKQKERGGVHTERHFNSFGGGANLYVYPHRDVEVFLSGNLSSVEILQGEYRTTFLLNGGMRYKQKNYEIELAGRNLTNRNKEISHYYTGLDIFTSTQYLRPIEVMLTLSWKF